MPPPIRWRWKHADICPLSGDRGPQSWKKLGLVTQSACAIFFLFLACALPVWSTISMQNFGRGLCTLPDIWRKNGVCYLEQCTLQRLLAQLFAGRVAGVTLQLSCSCCWLEPDSVVLHVCRLQTSLLASNGRYWLSPVSQYRSVSSVWLV